MRGGIKIMKKLFLVSFLLFIPTVVHSETFISSSEQLTAQNLPLYVNILTNLYMKEVAGQKSCTTKDDILSYFIEGTIQVPFSAEQLLKLCRRNTTGLSTYETRFCRQWCTKFVFNYIKEATRPQQDTGHRPLNFDTEL